MKFIFVLVLLQLLSAHAENVEDWAIQKINEETGRHVNVENLFIQVGNETHALMYNSQCCI